MIKVTAVWTGFSGAPGYSNFYFGGGLDGLVSTTGEAQACGNRVRTFLAAVGQWIPAKVKIDVLPQIQELNYVTGELRDEYTMNPLPAQVGSTQAGGFPGPAGGCVSWKTNKIIAGKKLRGRTFLVPLAGGAFQDDGTLVPNAVSDITGAANALRDPVLPLGEALVVWKRPVNKLNGGIGRVTSASFADKAAVLRSRRG